MNQSQPQSTESSPPVAVVASAKKKSKKKTRTPRTARPVFAEGIAQATGGEMKKIDPLHIQADHAGNQRWDAYETLKVVLDLNQHARDAHAAAVVDNPKLPEPVEIDAAELIKVIGPRCCFTAAEIEQRIESFRVEGQLEPVTIHVSSTGIPQLEVGFLRHAAASVLALRGELADFPRFKGTKVVGLNALLVARPKGQGDYAKAARRNLAENLHRKELSPIDMARYAVRQLASFGDDGEPRTKAEVAAEMGLAPSSLPRYLQLWNDSPPDVHLAVHEGRMTMHEALKTNKEKGRGNTRGAQPAMSVSKLRHAIARVEERPQPTTSLTPDEMVLLLRCYSGEQIDDLPEGVSAWVNWMQAEKAPKPPKPGKKAKALPPKQTSTITVSGGE